MITSIIFYGQEEPLECSSSLYKIAYGFFYDNTLIFSASFVSSLFVLIVYPRRIKESVFNNINEIVKVILDDKYTTLPINDSVKYTRPYFKHSTLIDDYEEAFITVKHFIKTMNLVR